MPVEPKTDSSKWENVETLETSFEKKEELIREMAKELFEEMIVSTLWSGRPKHIMGQAQLGPSLLEPV